MHGATTDDEILRLHRQGLATGAIAIRLGVESSRVRIVVQEQAQASKPHYDAKARAKTKVAKAQEALRKAAAELEGLR
jgi:hypothetical protein